MAKVNVRSYRSLASSIQAYAQSSSAGDRLSSTTRLGPIVAKEMSRRSVPPSYHRYSFYSSV
ncbi:hypothetical protein N7465_008416 [Penicillium sp. CMV-2018d]|nr:hypothetical protein N7465_008416 [Penicillium sp. CMV-2018d]